MADSLYNYQPNSMKSKKEKAEQQEEKKEIHKVVKGNTISKKESMGKKFSETFFAESLRNVVKAIWFEGIVPAIKDTFVDSISNATNMMVYGEKRKPKSSNVGKASYASYYRGSSNAPERSTRRSGDRYAYNEIIFETRGDAQEVKDCLDDILDRYKMVSIADFYELAGQETSWSDEKYGWFDLEGMAITRDRDGYRIRLPKAEPLD